MFTLARTKINRVSHRHLSSAGENEKLLEEELGEDSVVGSSLERCSIRWGNFAEKKNAVTEVEVVEFSGMC